MNRKVFRVYCIAGPRLDRTPQTPVKKATVDLKDEVLRKGPNPQEKAKYLAMEILKSEIEKDPQLRSGHHWEVKSMEVDLLEYATPNLTTTAGRAWLN